MRKTFMFVLIVIMLVGRVSSLESTDSWRVVANSHLIIKGILHVNVDEIKRILKSKPMYYKLSLEVEYILKGEYADRIILINKYIRVDEYEPTVEYIINLNGCDVIAFLTKIDDKYSEGYYFSLSTNESLQEATETNIRDTCEEILKQDDILEKGLWIYDTLANTYDDIVKDLIEHMLDVNEAEESYRMLEELGQNAVPSIIRFMDDRRVLPMQNITLENPPDFWEAVRFYSPDLVVDVLAAILNQITGESFGFINSGGSERERREAVKGWRIYLWYLTHGDT